MEPVKPISAKSQAETQKASAKSEKTEKVNIGGVLFNKNEIKESRIRNKNGEKINTVFLKPGLKLEFPDQTDPNKKPTVESMGLQDEWYNPDRSHIIINDLENAKIYGTKNKDDHITMWGKSSGNEIFIDQKESWYVNKNMRHDTVELYPGTSNNTVHMDEADKTEISYNQTKVTIKDKDGTETEIQSPVGTLEVEGEGTSEQELQLKDALGDNYKLHKHLQK